MLMSANFSLGVVKKTYRMTQLCVNNISTKFRLYIFISYSVFEKMRGGGGGGGICPNPGLRSPKKPSPNRVKLGLTCLNVSTKKLNLCDLPWFLSLWHYITLKKERVNGRSTFNKFNWNVQHCNDFI